MDRYITLGIAGHVDHGKTSLVKCLTGVDTDRMKEEKRRGVSIEAGIAPWIVENGVHIACVDVPGHTDFLKNTVRGLSSVDLAVLVVAADDGVMPQTLEHLETLQYLGVKGGFVVLSKIDLVDEETRELAELEVRDILRGTFLDHKPLIRFSAQNRQGIDEVRTAAILEARMNPAKRVDSPFKLWIDQVRHVNGFGTVVSGTVLSGSVGKDDAVTLFPGGVETRVRFLQSHGQRVVKAVAGQRVGINLHHVSVAEAGRGTLIAGPGSVSPSFLANVELKARANQKIPIIQRMKVKVFLGTSVIPAMVVIMGAGRVEPGGSARVQLRFSEAVTIQPGDRFVVSAMNVNSIIAGGWVLEIPFEKFTEARAAGLEPVLRALEVDDVAAFVENSIAMAVNRPLTLGLLRQRSGIDADKIQKVLDRLVKSGVLMDFKERGCLPTSRYLSIKERVFETVGALIRKNTLKSGVNTKEIQASLGLPLMTDVVPFMLNDLCNEHKLVKDTKGYSIQGYRAVLSSEDERMEKRLLAFAEESGFVPFSASRFCAETNEAWNEDRVKRMLHYLHNQGRLIRLSNKRFISVQAMETIKERVRNRIHEAGVIHLSDSQALLGYGRTMAVPVFEYLDTLGFTQRVGDGRRLAEQPVMI